jgi:hypothetical protein
MSQDTEQTQEELKIEIEAKQDEVCRQETPTPRMLGWLKSSLPRATNSEEFKA